MNLDFSRQFFEKKKLKFEFHENPSNESSVVPCRQKDGQTDITKLTVALRNFATAPKNGKLYISKHCSYR